MAKLNFITKTTEKRDDFSSQLNGIQSQFTLAFEPIGSTLKLFRNGILQKEGSSYDFTRNGKTITITFKARTGSNLEAVYFYKQQ